MVGRPGLGGRLPQERLDARPGELEPFGEPLQPEAALVHLDDGAAADGGHEDAGFGQVLLEVGRRPVAVFGVGQVAYRLHGCCDVLYGLHGESVSDPLAGG